MLTLFKVSTIISFCCFLALVLMFALMSQRIQPNVLTNNDNEHFWLTVATSSSSCCINKQSVTILITIEEIKITTHVDLSSNPQKKHASSKSKVIKTCFVYITKSDLFANQCKSYRCTIQLMFVYRKVIYIGTLIKCVLFWSISYVIVCNGNLRNLRIRGCMWS